MQSEHVFKIFWKTVIAQTFVDIVINIFCILWLHGVVPNDLCSSISNSYGALSKRF